MDVQNQMIMWATILSNQITKRLLIKVSLSSSWLMKWCHCFVLELIEVIQISYLSSLQKLSYLQSNIIELANYPFHSFISYSFQHKMERIRLASSFIAIFTEMIAIFMAECIFSSMCNNYWASLSVPLNVRNQAHL